MNRTKASDQNGDLYRTKALQSVMLFAGAAIVVTAMMAGTAKNDFAATDKRTAGQLYGKYCVECHGRDGRGTTAKGKHNHARDIAEAKWQDDVSDERIYNSIMNGRNVRGNMPSFSKKISDGEADSLVTYIRQLRR